MNEKLIEYVKRPDIYAKSSNKFWDDEHISKGMLEAHLNPEWDAATRKLSFIDASVDWIVESAPLSQFTKLLDMGCGPGIYTERFYEKGYQVTGIDLSKRSIEYAKDIAQKKGYIIHYINCNYLDMEFENEFDVITLIYCDFGVLSDIERNTILQKVYRSLKPGGKFIVDVFTPKQYDNRPETTNWQLNDSGFWSPKPHLCLNSLYRYDEDNTMLNQTVVVTNEDVNCYNIWEHTFTLEELRDDMNEVGLKTLDFFGDVAGRPYDENSSTLCVIATK